MIEESKSDGRRFKTMNWIEYLSMWISKRAWEYTYDPQCDKRITKLVKNVGESCYAQYGYDSRVGLAIRWHLGDR